MRPGEAAPEQRGWVPSDQACIEYYLLAHRKAAAARLPEDDGSTGKGVKGKTRELAKLVVPLRIAGKEGDQDGMGIREPV